MQQALRHPLYPGAITKDDVRPGEPFKWYGRDDNGQPFVKTGTFESHALLDTHDEYYAIVRFDGESKDVEVSLITLSILPNSEGNWRSCVSVSTANDMSDD